ncbi:hypothetical protein BKA64DRAFT_700188 [Cadophora sp. MPI-SDFR-AT-0126]|nr:hypothetical protein BKA64DRAFT_700188 [Leotiomycetes sp. MPI-SDFR-AT-0126]
MASESAPRDADAIEGHHLEWSQIGSTTQDLQISMESLYWTGVKRDVLDIIHTLRTWRGEEYSQVSLKEDQLCYGSKIPFAHLGLETFLGRSTDLKSTKMQSARDSIKSTMRTAASRGSYPKFERIAHTLLQAAAFLDVDKLVEHRPPLEKLEIWSRPRVPQLQPGNEDHPKFTPLYCTSCTEIIRGSHFRCLRGCVSTANTTQAISELLPPQILHAVLVYCETCTRAEVHPRSHMRKYQKHCVIKDSVDSFQGQVLCDCTSSRLTKASLFPFTDSQRKLHHPECGLLKVMPSFIKARLSDILRNNVGFSSGPVAKERTNAIKSLSNQLLKPIVCPVLDKIPFGNVHVGLMFGPLIIENGVPDSNSGARITIRDPLALASSNRRQDKQQEIISLSPEKIVYSTHVVNTRPRRVKAFMKQVVGGAFCEIRDVALEHEIITALAQESEACIYEPMKRQQYDDEKLEKAATRIVEMLRRLFQDKVRFYLETIVRRLCDTRIPLKWDVRTNHCQNFCESILNYEAFGSFMPTKEGCHDCPPPDPLYLVSFVCQPGSYRPIMVRPKSKKVAPNGLTEEYLFRFYKHGNHDDSDIIDTLMNYWHDWGAFGGTIFSQQNLFPWDCTEACRMGGDKGEIVIKCNDCSVMKHVWAFPFDSWSLVQLHMSRDRSFYEPEHEDQENLSDADWMRNRLDVLDALQALNAVAAAIFHTTEFRKSCRWIKPQAQEHLTERKDPSNAKRSLRRDRARLAGIFRAQPESHYFEQGKYHDCSLAPWGDLVRKDQVALYTKLRDFRADELSDVRDLYKKPIPKMAGSSPDPPDPVIPTTSKFHENKTETVINKNYGHSNNPWRDAMNLPYSPNKPENRALVLLPAMEHSFYAQGEDTDNQDRRRRSDDFSSSGKSWERLDPGMSWIINLDISWLSKATEAKEDALWKSLGVDFDDWYSEADISGINDDDEDSGDEDRDENDEDEGEESGDTTQGTHSDLCNCALQQLAEEQALTRAAELKAAQLAQLERQRAAQAAKEQIPVTPRVSSLRRLKNMFKSSNTKYEEQYQTTRVKGARFQLTEERAITSTVTTRATSSVVYNPKPKAVNPPQMLLN